MELAIIIGRACNIRISRALRITFAHAYNLADVDCVGVTTCTRIQK